MADDKLKTSPESPGQDRPGEMPAEAAPSMREPPAPETAEPEKVEEHTEPDQSVIPGMDEDAPARPAPGEEVVDFDKINELMSQRRAAAREAAGKTETVAVDTSGKETPAPEKKAPEADKPPKRRGRPPKEQAGPTVEKKSKAAEPRTGRPSKVDKAAREEAPPSVWDKVGLLTKWEFSTAEDGRKARNFMPHYMLAPR